MPSMEAQKHFSLNRSFNLLVLLLPLLWDRGHNTSIFHRVIGKNYLVSHYEAFYKYEVLCTVWIILESIKFYTVIKHYHDGLSIALAIYLFFLFYLLLSCYYVEKRNSSSFPMTKGLREFSGRERTALRKITCQFKCKSFQLENWHQYVNQNGF